MVFYLFECIKNAGCVIRSKYHIYCPGCGGTRAIEALLKLKLAESFHYNPLVLLFIVDLLVIVIVKVIERRKNNVRYYNIRIMVHSLFLLSVIIFFLYRNYMLLYKGVDLLGDLLIVGA